MSHLCKAGVFLTVNHHGPLPLRELHSTDETLAGEILGDLEPVYNLFTIMGEISQSVSLSCISYTRINSMHSQKTKQPYIQSTRKNRTRKKKSTVEEAHKKAQRFFFFNEPFE